MGPKTGPNTWLVGGLGVDDHRRWRRFRASHNTGTAPADQRLVRLILGSFSVSAGRVALKKFAGITLSGWARFAIAFLIIVVGRLVLKIEGRGTFIPH